MKFRRNGRKSEVYSDEEILEDIDEEDMFFDEDADFYREWNDIVNMIFINHENKNDISI